MERFRVTPANNTSQYAPQQQQSLDYGKWLFLFISSYTHATKRLSVKRGENVHVTYCNAFAHLSYRVTILSKLYYTVYE